MYHNKLITTGCCDKSKLHKVVTLSFESQYDMIDGSDDDSDNHLYSKNKPVWKSKGFVKFREHILEGYIEVEYCPFCGTKVPEIEINEEAVKNNKIHESKDLNYCDTCDERNMCCECLPPEFRWKPVGVDVEIPMSDFVDDE